MRTGGQQLLGSGDRDYGRYTFWTNIPLWFPQSRGGKVRFARHLFRGQVALIIFNGERNSQIHGAPTDFGAKEPD